MKASAVLDRLALAARLAVFVLGTKDKTVLNHVSRGLDKAKAVKDLFRQSPDETLKRGDEGVVIIELLIFCIILAPVAIALLS